MASSSEQKAALRSTSSVTPTAQVASRPTIAPTYKICRNFAQGNCRFGEKCKFIHSAIVLPTAIKSTQHIGGVGTKAVKPLPVEGDCGSPSQQNPRSRHIAQPERSSNSRKVQNTRSQPCRNWKVGRCTFGDECQFSHGSSQRPVTVLLEEQAPPFEETVISQKAERLANERRARLTKENAARKQHEAETEARLTREAEVEKRHQAMQEARVQRAKKASDAQEAAQRQKAQEAARQARLAEQDALRIEREAAVTTQHIVLGSSLVTFGAGLEVRSVVSGFESCRLTIRNIPSDATPPEIAELFTQQGMSREDIHILSLHPVHGSNHLEAKVLTSSAQGGLIAIGLDGIEFRNETLQFEVGQIMSTNAMGESNSRQADTLTITWFTPSVTMIATYSTMDLAQQHQRLLDKKTIDGRKIKAEMNRPPTNLAALRHYNAASVKITGIPMGTTVMTITDMAGAFSVRAIKSNLYDLEGFIRDLRQQLDSLPDNRMISFTRVADRQADGLMMIKAQFETWEGANTARASLEGKRLRPDYPSIRLLLPPPLHFTSTIPTQQYEAQQRLWEAFAEPSANKGPRVHIDRVPAKGFVNIRLSGDDKKLVGALKVRVETLIAGERLDATYWHRSFLWVKGREFLAKVFSSTKVYVRSDFKTQSLRIFGEGEAKQRARQMIEDEVGRLAQQEWSVNLKRQSVGYFVRKGLAALKEILGEDGASLDLASNPCKLTIRGGEEARHILNNVMDQALNDLDFGSSDGDDICPICYDAVSNPVVLGCKHVYCTACIRHYFTSASESKVFPLACMGDDAKCKVPIAIPVIQRFLIRQQYEDLINVAFSTHLDRHPQDFRYCTTPDCTQIYRANTQTLLKCPSCFAEVCSLCHEEAHEGMSCEGRRAQKTLSEEQLNDRWATAHGIKRCPSCSVYIEKTQGCNHMECRCGAHICWICVMVFPVGEIYAHLGTVHGGAFDGDGERRNLDLQHALALQREEQGGENRQQLVAREIREAQRLLHEQERRAAEQRNAEAWQAALRRQQAQAELRQIEARQERLAREAEYQRQIDARQERLTREAEERQRARGGGGCLIM